MATVNLKINQLKNTLKFVIENNKRLQEEGKNPIACEVIGESGMGKTSGILQLCNELKLPMVKLSLSQIEELGDLIGFPLRQFQMCLDGTKDCLWVDEQAVGSYEKQGYIFTGEKRMSYCPPEWIVGKEDGGVLLVDDWTRSDMRMIQALMELIDRQEYISWRLPKGWNIVLTANPADGNYIVTEIDPAQRSRFISFNLEFDKLEWAKWAEFNGIDGRAINFVLKEGWQMISGTGVGKDKDKTRNKAVNPRSATMFFNTISGIKDFSANLPMIQLLGEGSVGEEFTVMFTTFIENKLDLLPTPEFIMHEKLEDVEKAVLAVMGSEKDKTYRADIGSVLMTRIINYSLHYAKENTIDDKFIKRLTKLVTTGWFLKDLEYAIVREIFAGDKTKFKKLTSDATVQEMLVS